MSSATSNAVPAAGAWRGAPASPQLRWEEVCCLLCGSEGRAPLAAGPDYEYETSHDVFHVVRCLNCGHAYLNPRPDISSAAIIYPADYYTLAEAPPAGGLALLNVIKTFVLGRRVRGLLQGLPENPAVLEIGCGDGALLLAVRRKLPAARLVGLDLRFSRHHREALRSRGVEVVEGPLESADLSGTYDLVIMNQLVEHLWDVRGSLGRLRGVVKTGGLLSIATPNLDGYDRRLFAAGTWGGYYFPRHLNLFSRKALTELLAEYGFETVRHRSLTAPLIWRGSLYARLKAQNSWLRHLVRDWNLPLLAAFTALDLVAMACGAATSNQQVIARKS